MVLGRARREECPGGAGNTVSRSGAMEITYLDCDLGPGENIRHSVKVEMLKVTVKNGNSGRTGRIEFRSDCVPTED